MKNENYLQSAAFRSERHISKSLTPVSLSQKKGAKNSLVTNRGIPINLSLAFLLIFVFNEIQAQSTPTLLNPNNTFIQQRIEQSDSEGWLYFKNSSDLKAGDLFSQQKAAAGLSINDTMLLFESETDEQGCTHNRYQQYYKNIKVEGGEFFEHICDCYVYLVNGKIIEGLNFNAQPTYTEQQALTSALAHLSASKYAWEDLDWEEGLQEDTEDMDATYYPTGVLTLTNSPGTLLETANYSLNWRFDILALDPRTHKAVYVNSNTGVVTKTLDLDRDNGPATTLFDGIQIVDTRWVGGLFHGHHHLRSDDNGKDIETKSGTGNVEWKKINHFNDNDDDWTSTLIGRINTTTAHWAVNRCLDFFKATYGRDDITNTGNGKIRVYGNSTELDNAYWDNEESTNTIDYIEFGSTSSSNPFGVPSGINFATLDIAGHELTHGITAKEANLIYSGESGALNESFSDIFGFMVERFARNGASNWTQGEDLGVSIRDMEMPSAGFWPQPSTFGIIDPLWINTVGCIPVQGLPPTVPAGNDLCGVHINSGVQNRWFFLLSQGGTQNGVTIQGIGIDKAARIAYHNLCNFLGANSNYAQSRLGAIGSARILFGTCSNEEIQTTNAWAAVGVGPVFTSNCVTLKGEPFVCNDVAFFPFCYTAQGLPGANFTWSFPSSWTGTTSGVGNKYLCITNFGNFNPPGGFPATVTITVTSSLGGTASMTVIVEDDCKPLCGNGGERSPEKNLLSSNAPKLGASIYPNPANSRINISCFGGNPQLISVFSSLGENLMAFTPSEPSLVLDVSNLSNGVYFVKIQFENQTITKKISKTE